MKATIGLKLSGIVVGKLREQHTDHIVLQDSQRLSPALGDFVATTTGLGFERGSAEFAGLLALVAVAHFLTKIPKSVIFWSAYVLTRPLGATLGDTLTKSHVETALDWAGSFLR